MGGSFGFVPCGSVETQAPRWRWNIKKIGMLSVIFGLEVLNHKETTFCVGLIEC